MLSGSVPRWPLADDAPESDRLRPAPEGRRGPRTGRAPTGVLEVTDQPGASLVIQAVRTRSNGSDVVPVVTARGRNRVAVEGDLAALVDLGVDMVRVDSVDGPDLTAADVAALAAYAGLDVVPAGAGGPEVTSTATRPGEPAVRSGCPKQMRFGPCGGVRTDAICETGARRCVFVDDEDPAGPERWQADPQPMTAAAAELTAIAARRPLVVSGFPAVPLDSTSVRDCADLLRGAADACLAGDSGRARVQFPPAYRAHLMTRAGLRVWSGLNCRDRGAAELERQLADLHRIGVAAVHCVTGDHTDLGDRPDARPVFESEGSTLVPVARTAGHLVSFAESPLAPPRHDRARRAAGKAAAGGRVCLLQYAGEVADTAEFVAAVHAASSAPLWVLPGVPLVIDRAGAAVLRDFVGGALPRGYAESVLDSADPVRAGIDAAVALGEHLLAVDGVTGVVVAGGPAPGREPAYAEALARVCRRLGGGA